MIETARRFTDPVAVAIYDDGAFHFPCVSKTVNAARISPEKRFARFVPIVSIHSCALRVRRSHVARFAVLAVARSSNEFSTTQARAHRSERHHFSGRRRRSFLAER